MIRAFRIILYCSLGFLLIGAGLIVPAHLRAIDAAVFSKAPGRSNDLVEQGLQLAKVEKPGPAELLSNAAHNLAMNGANELAGAISSFYETHPEFVWLGGADAAMERSVPRGMVARTAPHTVVEIFLRREVRQEFLKRLESSRRPGVVELLRNRALTTTVQFPPVYSASGQPLEAAILLSAFLVEEDYLRPEMRASVESLASAANRAGEVENLENFYLDLLSLGRRLNWVQLTRLLTWVQDPRTLSQLAHLARSEEESLDVIYSAVELSGTPSRVAAYLFEFGATGVDDLQFSLQGGESGVNRLLRERAQVHYPGEVRREAAVRDPYYWVFDPLVKLSHRSPWAAWITKYGFLALGAFLLGRGFSVASRPASPFDQPVSAGIRAGRQFLFALCFALAVLVLGEPFLVAPDQHVEFPLRLRLPILGGALSEETAIKLEPIMNQITIVTLAVFLVVQAIIYVLCLMKLAEIRRQALSSEVKIKLLDNEENMFDAGLYVGLGGTVGALIFMAVSNVQPVLLAAYASTLFGIIFVALLKICHLRPYRRRLIMETESLRS